MLYPLSYWIRRMGDGSPIPSLTLEERRSPLRTRRRQGLLRHRLDVAGEEVDRLADAGDVDEAPERPSRLDGALQAEELRVSAGDADRLALLVGSTGGHLGGLDPVEVLDTLTHELVHAVDDCQHRHGKEFKEIALAVGLQGKMREASAGPQLRLRLQSIAGVMVSELGPYPHAKLSVGGTMYESARKPARAECPRCRFKVSMLRNHLKIGPPICPKYMLPMEKRGDWD